MGVGHGVGHPGQPIVSEEDVGVGQGVGHPGQPIVSEDDVGVGHGVGHPGQPIVLNSDLCSDADVVSIIRPVINIANTAITTTKIVFFLI